MLTGLPARLRARARAPRARRATPAKPVLHQAGTVHGPAGRAKRRCARAFGADGSRRAEHAGMVPARALLPNAARVLIAGGPRPALCNQSRRIMFPSVRACAEAPQVAPAAPPREQAEQLEAGEAEQDLLRLCAAAAQQRLERVATVADLLEQRAQVGSRRRRRRGLCAAAGRAGGACRSSSASPGRAGALRPPRAARSGRLPASRSPGPSTAATVAPQRPARRAGASWRGSSSASTTITS